MVKGDIEISKSLSSRIFNSLSIMLLVLDDKGVAIDCNDALRSYLKMPKKSILGKLLLEIILKIGDYSKSDIINTFELTRKRKSIEIKVGNKYLKITADPVIDNNKKIENIIIIISDITERKNSLAELESALRKAKESDQLKSAFLSNISHEIRTPINGIMGFTTLLEGKNLTTKKSKSYLNIINNCSNQLLTIIRDILDFSKIETGQLEIYSKVFNIEDFIKLLYQRFKIQFNERGITYNLCFTNSTNVKEINTDRGKLDQLISNLLSNALKFTKKGNVELSCNVKSNHLEIYIKDTGIGIEKSSQKMVFDRFWQAELEISKKIDGNGLGLSICKGFVELLGGKIWLDSEKGKGSTFYFEIPF
jgi:PAS domain S-box-containing protein